MLRWRKSPGSQAQTGNGIQVRPPWIQKIVAEGIAKPVLHEEQVFRSRLAEKLAAMKEAAPAEAPRREPVPVARVAGATTDSSATLSGGDFAFHLAPLNAIIPERHDEPRAFHTPQPDFSAAPAAVRTAEPRFTQPQAEPQSKAPAGDYNYVIDAKAEAPSAAMSYELSHSTVAYERGDAFDLEQLFDEVGISNGRAWNPPAEALESLLGEVAENEEAIFNPRVTKTGETIDTQDDEWPVDAGEIRATDEKTAVAEVKPEVAPVPELEKPRKSTSPGARLSDEPLVRDAENRRPAKPVINNAIDRASITPVLTVNRQREILFPLLKTQKRALEFANPAEAQHVIEKLEETLEQFSIDGHVVGIQRGPIITRYELKMAAGIKVNRILALTDELAMALEAMRVRIEAPIPGRSTVGIEIPNKQRIKVLLGDILNDVGYKEFGGALPLPLGRDIAGNLLLEDLTRMPHLLIAGATGSGKSVAVNSFISSLILHKTPEEVRFLLVDPKLVELSGYNDIPHLLHPVITEPNKAILALNWAVEEMERRYEDLADMSTRDIRSYNEKVKSLKANPGAGRTRASAATDGNGAGDETPIMPYIVVLIDELGDLMMVAGKEVESSIIRLAQKARAVGIHLILATQRPSVDVITALIKANCPARIALQVAQKTDSRTILDGNGAEQLLGQGDMLFRHPSKAQLIRAQVPLIEDNEVEDVVAYAKKLAKPVYITLEDPKGKMGELEAGDEELFEEAWQIIVESQKASASYLQRRLRIGYNKAARLIEAFEARGMIGPQIGSKPREIIGGLNHVSGQ